MRLLGSLRILALATVVLLPALVPVAAQADASTYPVGPQKAISMVRGQPISVVPLAEDESFFEEVRFAVDGKAIQTDNFAPFGDFIPTKRFDRLGFALEQEHILTASSIDFFSETETEVERYPLVIHALPVIPRVHVYPLVFENRSALVGFQLHGIPLGGRVRAWGRGFIHGNAWAPLSLRVRKRGERSRTYVVPGGLAWVPWSHPHVIFSIAPRRGSRRYGFEPRGRLFAGVLRTRRNGDTSIRQTDGWRRCTYMLSWRGKPPPKVSCVYLF
jgi:hypothetical protein